GARAGRVDALRNGDFEADNTYPPIDWLLSSDTDLAVAREQLPVPGPANAGVTFRPPSTADQRVLWQLLRLAPGRYRFSGRSGSVASGAQPYWIMYCAVEPPASSLLNLTVPASEGPGRYAAAFTVPDHRCDNQVVALVARPADAGASARVWVDSIAIER